MLLGVALILWQPPLYESRVVVQIGHVNGTIVVEPAAVLVERLTEQYRIKDITEGPQPMPQLVSIKANKGVPDIVTLSARAHTAEEAQHYLVGVVAKLQAEHESTYQEATQQQRDRVELISRRIEQIRQHPQPHGDSGALKTVSPAQKENLLQEVEVLGHELASLNIGLSKIQTQPTRLIRDPTLPVNPVQPRPLLYLGLATAGGIIFGLICVFMAEYIAQARHRLRTSVDG